MQTGGGDPQRQQFPFQERRPFFETRLHSRGTCVAKSECQQELPFKFRDTQEWLLWFRNTQERHVSPWADRIPRYFTLNLELDGLMGTV